MMTGIRWKVRERRSGYVWEGPLVACWEVSGDPISDNYTPDDIDAHELLRLWLSGANENFPDGMVPIYWFVSCVEEAKFEGMPFQYPHFPDSDDFLTFYDWPEHAETGERLNWLSLPVKDKLWNKRRDDTGGFIQEATGWKPNILQPFVYLPSLAKGIG